MWIYRAAGFGGRTGVEDTRSISVDSAVDEYQLAKEGVWCPCLR